MKERIGLAFALAAAIALLAAVRLLPGSRVLTVQPAPSAQADARDRMRVSLAYDTGTRTLRGTQELAAVNRSGAALEEIVLRLSMNGRDEEAVTLSGVTLNGESAAFSLDESDPTLARIACAWQPGETITLAWTVMIRHPKGAGAAVVTLPQLGMLENGAWRTDAYDELAEPVYAEVFDYTINLVLRDGTAAAFGGALTEQSRDKGAGETLYTAQMSGARDVSFALLAGGSVRQRMADGVLLTALADSASGAGALLDRAQEAIRSLAAAGFAYPFASLTAAAGDAGWADGTALSGLIVLDAEGNKETQLRRVTRLVARQTFGVLVENDPWNAPWLSISLASAAEMLAYRERKGASAFEERFLAEVDVATRLTRPAGVNVGAGTAFFGGDAEMTQVLRDQGAAMLLGIELAAGSEAFARSLSQYVQDHAGKTASREGLEAALLAGTGSDWNGYLTDELSW